MKSNENRLFIPHIIGHCPLSEKSTTTVDLWFGDKPIIFDVNLDH